MFRAVLFLLLAGSSVRCFRSLSEELSGATRATSRRLQQACPATPGTYTVKSGDGLQAIADTCGTSTQCLQTANSISNPDLIQVNQTLKVPASCADGATSAPAPSPSGCPAITGTYTIKMGDTFLNIAAACDTTTDCLQSANSNVTDAASIQAGATLHVPAACAAAPAPAPSSGCGGTYTGSYVVQPGDTTFNLAQICGISQTCLTNANAAIQANPANLQQGQTLKVPSSCRLATQSSASAPSSSSSGKGSSNTGAIVGGVVGGVVGAVLVAAVLFFVLRRRQSAPSKPPIATHLTNPWDQPSASGSLQTKRTFGDWIHGRPSKGSRRGSQGTAPTTNSSTMTDSSGGPISDKRASSSNKMMPLHSQSFQPEIADNPNMLRFDDLAIGEAESRGPAPATNIEHTKMMIEQDLPEELQKFWRYDRKQLLVHLDEQGLPVTLGKGAFGTVYKGTLGLRTVAIKVVHSTSEVEQARFVQEIARLRVLRDPNIVMFLGASLQSMQTVLVMEYLPNGNLWDALGRDIVNHEGNRQLQWYRGGHKIALDIARGLYYLHDKGIVHFDLKSPNILLDEHNTARIADIGLSKIMAGSDVKASPGTTLWASPEQLQRKLCSQASDIYSFGVILWEICSGLPLKSRTLSPLRIPQDCPRQIADLVLLCCDSSPAARPSIDAVFNVLKSAPKSMYH